MDNVNKGVGSTVIPAHSGISTIAVVIIQLVITFFVSMLISIGMFGMSDFTNLKYVVYLVLILPVIIWLLQNQKSKGLIIGTIISLIILFALSFVFWPIALLL
jgi:hypothetical protein